MVHIWMTDPTMPVLVPDSVGFQKLPPTVQQLLLRTRDKRVYAHEPVPPSTSTTQLLTDNLQNYLFPDNLPFAEKAIRWYNKLPLNHNSGDNMTGVDNGILMAYGMCPPCKLQEYYQLDPDKCPTHLYKGLPPMSGVATPMRSYTHQRVTGQTSGLKISLLF
jgi:hypothetical protein